MLNPNNQIMYIKEFYLNQYPTDDMGEELNEHSTFHGLYLVLHEGGDVYEYIGAHDSLIRERLFTELANVIDEPYDFVYQLWLSKTYHLWVD